MFAGAAALLVCHGAPASACELHDADVGWDAFDQWLRSRQAAAPPSQDFDLRAVARYTRRTSGSTGYGETRLRAEYLGARPWSVGLVWPLIAASDAGEPVLGPGNPTFFGEGRLELSASLSLAFGAQVEAPVGADPRLAEQHVELLPYTQLRYTAAELVVFASLGWLRSLEGRGHAHSGELLVESHAESELLLSLGAQLPLGLRPKLTVDARRVLVDAPGPAHLINLTALVPVRLGDSVALSFFGELPLTRPGRLAWRLGAGAGVTL